MAATCRCGGRRVYTWASSRNGFAKRYHPDREFGIRCFKAGLVGRFEAVVIAFHHYARSLRLSGRRTAGSRHSSDPPAALRRSRADRAGRLGSRRSVAGAMGDTAEPIRGVSPRGVGVGRGTRSTARTDARAYAPTDGLEAPDADGASEGPVRVVRMRKPSCSVVVCTRHRPALLARCLASRSSSIGATEVIVVDNTRRTRGRARTAEAGARYVVESRVGLSRARNTGRPGCRGRGRRVHRR